VQKRDIRPEGLVTKEMHLWCCKTNCAIIEQTKTLIVSYSQRAVGKQSNTIW